MSAVKHIRRAEAAFARGKCLVAGQAIDRAYVALGAALGEGRAKKSRLWKRLKRVDEKFEHACVRRSPK